MSASAAGSFQPFELEYYQSRYEHDVEINLADSSVQCVSTREWLTEAEQQRLLDTPLYYPMVNGGRAPRLTGSVRPSRGK